MSTESRPFAYGAECRHRVLLDDECQRCKAEEAPADATPTPERGTLVGDDLTLVERVRAEAALCRAMGRACGAYRLERIATDLAAREQALREEERSAWSSWLDTWLGALGPTPPTVEAVADALRSGPRPFGIARGGAR